MAVFLPVPYASSHCRSVPRTTPQISSDPTDRGTRRWTRTGPPPDDGTPPKQFFLDMMNNLLVFPAPGWIQRAQRTGSGSVHGKITTHPSWTGTPMTQTSPARKAVRALVVNGRDELLLIHWEDPLDGHEILEPHGGAVEPEESLEAALIRETAEETGWDIQLCGTPRPHLRKTTWAGQTYEGTEWFCLARPLTAGQQALETYERPWFRG